MGRQELQGFQDKIRNEVKSLFVIFGIVSIEILWLMTPVKFRVKFKLSDYLLWQLPLFSSDRFTVLHDIISQI